MRIRKILGVLGVLGLTLAGYQRAVASTAAVPVNELTLVEESEVECPLCAEEEKNADASSEDAEVGRSYGGYGAHHHHHHGGYGGYGSHHHHHNGGYGGYGSHHHHHQGGYGGYGSHHHHHGHGHYHYHHGPWRADEQGEENGEAIPQPQVDLKN